MAYKDMDPELKIETIENRLSELREEHSMIDEHWRKLEVLLESNNDLKEIKKLVNDGLERSDKSYRNLIKIQRIFNPWFELNEWRCEDANYSYQKVHKKHRSRIDAQTTFLCEHLDAAKQEEAEQKEQRIKEDRYKNESRKGTVSTETIFRDVFKERGENDDER